jgi:hypothetical protein
MTTRERTRQIVFWVVTGVIAWEMTAGAMWDLLQIEFTRSVFDRLGYPHYLLLILGAWKLPCAFVWLAPRLARVKEWAYAGAFFNYTGAAASHVLAHDRAVSALGPAVFAALTIASWALRPADRRRASPEPRAVRPIAWIVPAGVVGALLVLALITLPAGPA